MRYVAKVHVTDVLDQIVISGYVVDCDEMTDPDHQAFDFTYQVPGVGQPTARVWLVDALARAMIQAKTQPLTDE